MKKKRKGLKVFGYSIQALVGVILFGAAGWAFYGLINSGTSDLLDWLAKIQYLGFLNNGYAQKIFVILFVFVIGLVLFGHGANNTVKKILK